MTQTRTSLDWLLKDLPGDVPGTRHVVVLSADGLRIAQHTTDDDAADRISAACAGLQSLATALGAEFPGGNRGTRLIAVECAGGYFSMMAAGPGAFLAVLADRGTDPGLLGDRMRDLVARIGDHLASPPRTGAPTGW